MSYHKQLQKQKRKQMTLEREKLNKPKNNAYSQPANGAIWKTLLSIVFVAGIILYSYNGGSFV